MSTPLQDEQFRAGASGGGPLSESDLAELARARRAARGIRRGVAVSQVSAWATGIFGGLTLLGGVFGDVVSLALGAGLIAIGVREGMLGSRLRRFDPASPRALAVNQLALGAVIVVYAAVRAWGAWRSTGLSEGSQPIGDAQVDAMLAEVGSMVRMVSVGVYATVGVGGAIATGLTALFYSRRTAMVRAFVGGQREWVVRAMRAAA